MLLNYKDLKVWQKSYELCIEIYRITATFPIEKGELGPLKKTSQKSKEC
ncbi:MAG: four helix bundle protein [Deltaproteobacteria bacterium]|nr:four helix bundle protein [Deltaproteobacteria bacterium]